MSENEVALTDKNCHQEHASSRSKINTNFGTKKN